MEDLFKEDKDLDWIDDLSQNHFVILENFLTKDFIIDLQNCFYERLENDKFKKAGIGSTDNKLIDKSIRGDNIFWLDKSSSDLRIKAYFDLMDQIKFVLNRYCFLSISDYEFHFAHYPIGTFYKRHLDQFQGRNNRLISTVFYLNEDWKPSHGGELRLFLENGDLDISPKFGRLVLFKSDIVEHEVLKTNADRFSITGWMLYKPIGLELITSL